VKEERDTETADGARTRGYVVLLRESEEEVAIRGSPPLLR